MANRMSTGAALTALNTPLTDAPSMGSVNDFAHRGSGFKADKPITLNVNNGTQSLNCFQVIGTVEIKKLYAFITDATSLANCTAAFFETDDGAAQVALTLNDGVLSGMGVGTFIAKTATAASTMSIANNAAGAIVDAGFSSFAITQKTTQNTYIRFTYTSTDAPVNAQMMVFCEYVSMGADGDLIAA